MSALFGLVEESRQKGKLMKPLRDFKSMIGCVGGFLLIGLCASAQTPSKALLVLEKDTTQLDIIDPVSTLR